MTHISPHPRFEQSADYVYRGHKTDEDTSQSNGSDRIKTNGNVTRPTVCTKSCPTFFESIGSSAADVAKYIQTSKKRLCTGMRGRQAIASIHRLRVQPSHLPALLTEDLLTIIAMAADQNLAVYMIDDNRNMPATVLLGVSNKLDPNYIVIDINSNTGGVMCVNHHHVPNPLHSKNLPSLVS
jgi:hypothetical protein